MSDTVNIRELALDILLSVTKDGMYSHMILKQVLDKYQYLDKKDRAFLTRMTEGTLENLIQIDYIINQFSKVPVRKMKPAISCILRGAVYQIRYMDAVPDAAACNEAVRLAKKRGFKNLSGFVNGVLRGICRSKKAQGINKDQETNKGIIWPDPIKDPDIFLSVRYSIPKWMIQMWKKELGESENTQSENTGSENTGNVNTKSVNAGTVNTKSVNARSVNATSVNIEQMLQAFLSPAPVTIRTNTSLCTPEELERRLHAEGVSTVLCEKLPYAFHISGYDHLNALPSFREGLFYVQDLSSMLVAETAAPKEQEFVIDVCAAPGGKAVHMAQMMQGSGQVLARDLTQHKVDLLLENRKRCRISNMRAQVWDARVLDHTLVQKADLVVADLPCSGLGVMRRKKDIRFHMTLEKIAELADLQREILSVVCQYVKPGGRMIYSTCTISRQENEENASWFLNEHTEFTLVSSRQILPEAGGGDGFYIAAFARRQENEQEK